MFPIQDMGLRFEDTSPPFRTDRAINSECGRSVHFAEHDVLGHGRERDMYGLVLIRNAACVNTHSPLRLA
jgi:hypothetical protein